jgi:deoxyuridine 5'-triphosphate nucleotidohydrolase
MPKVSTVKRSRNPTSELLKVKRLFKDAKLPKRSSAGAAGYDLYSYVKVIIPPKSIVSIETGISIKVPNGCYGQIASRSGLAIKFGLNAMAGVIDPDYTGDVTVILINLGNDDYQGLCLFYFTNLKRRSFIHVFVLMGFSTTQLKRETALLNLSLSAFLLLKSSKSMNWNQLNEVRMDSALRE